MKRCLPILVLTCLCGCAVDPRDIGREPHMSAVGSGLSSLNELPPGLGQPRPRPISAASLWDDRQSELFQDPRATRIGDVVTVQIAINDQATLGNTTDRSLNSVEKNEFDSALSTTLLSGAATGSANATTTSSTQGAGNIVRSEVIKLSVAAIVTNVLPNGNLLVTGTQEVRVNFELRLLKVSGIVRPRDIGRDNSIAYDKIAEARISYGGRGRLTEVQQPTLTQQVFDIFKPM